MNFPGVYKAEFLKATETVDPEKVADAIRIMMVMHMICYYFMDAETA